MINIIKSGLSTFGAGINDVFGKPVKPPGPSFNDPVEGFGRVVIVGIRLVLIGAGFMVLIYMLWGAMDWINSDGDKENIQKAQQKITNAVIGVIILVAALGAFSVITGDVLGIIKKTEDGRWIFGLPTINQCVGDGGVCATDNQCCTGMTCDGTPSGKCIIAAPTPETGP